MQLPAMVRFSFILSIILKASSPISSKLPFKKKKNKTLYRQKYPFQNISYNSNFTALL